MTILGTIVSFVCVGVYTALVTICATYMTIKWAASMVCP